jgi:hypothetical protein
MFLSHTGNGSADAMVDGHQPERDGFALLGSSHSSFSLYIFMIYPFLPYLTLD